VPHKAVGKRPIKTGLYRSITRSGPGTLSHKPIRERSKAVKCNFYRTEIKEKNSTSSSQNHTQQKKATSIRSPKNKQVRKQTLNKRTSTTTTLGGSLSPRFSRHPPHTVAHCRVVHPPVRQENDCYEEEEDHEEGDEEDEEDEEDGSSLSLLSS